MSEFIPLADAGQDSGATTNAAVTTAGTLLRQGRVAAGLHIAALAVALKVPVRRLEALESDRFDLLPDAVFVRALASSVCRALRMDTAPVLALLPASVPPRLSSASARTHDSYTSVASGRGLPMWLSLPRPVVLSAAVLVLATVGMVSWPMVEESLATSDTGPAVSGSLAPAEVLEPSVDQAIIPAVIASEPQPAEPGPVVPATLAVTVPPVSVAVPAAASPAPVANTLRDASAVSGIVVFRPSAESWVEVTDAQGTVLLRRMLAAGEAAGASGALPLSAVVGRADVTQVLVRGQAFDLKTIARENVARFEVK